MTSAHLTADAASKPTLTINRTVSKSLVTDYEAVKNDLEQAVQFADELQKEVAVSKNAAAHFRQLFETTARDLERFQRGILALRKERHEFVNEVMMARGERDKLQKLVAELQQHQEHAGALLAERDGQIANLTMQTMMLKIAFHYPQELMVAQSVARSEETAFVERIAD